ncbi:MAG: HlyD family efflux transporter periplasmic adaptor subunit [Pseudomonadota bacterium]
MKKRLRIAIPVLIVVSALLIWNLFFRNGGNGKDVRISGNIEVTQVDMAFKIPGRLAERRVDEGDRIHRGDLVARLDPTDQTLQVRKAEADRDYARSVLAELEAGSRPEEIARAAARVQQMRYALKELETGSRVQQIAEAEAGLSQAKAAQQASESQRALAAADLARYGAVFRDGGISRQSYDAYRTQHETANNSSEEAAAQVRIASQRLSLVKEGPRSEQIRQARAALAQAEAELALVTAGPRQETIAQAGARATAAEEALNLFRQQLADTAITAPFDGVVLSKSAEPGAYLNPGAPVVTVAQIDQVWLRAFVSETDLGRIRLGQSAEVTTDGAPDKPVTGRLTFISSQAEFTPKSVQTFEERVNLMYRVKITLDNTGGRLKPGMPADAVIRIEK